MPQKTKHLAFHDVNIIQAISTAYECGLVVREEDLKKDSDGGGVRKGILYLRMEATRKLVSLYSK